MMSQHKNLSRDNSGKDKQSEVNMAAAAPKDGEPEPSNQLVAGYLAHEFLTKGTLLGRKIELNSVQGLELKASVVKDQTYRELANLLKTKGTHINGIVNPGIVNPTQLFNWINN